MGTLALIGTVATLALGSAAPAAFPGGSGEIAYTRFSTTSGAAIYVMQPDGSGIHPLVKGAVDPAWSADGRRLAYSVFDPKRRNGIFVSDANGRHARRITRTRPVGANQPAWAPDGKRIVFAARGYIYTVHPDGRVLKRITSRPFVRNPSGKLLNTRSTDSRPSWSPDGRTIAFVHHGYGGRDEIWTMRPDGSRQRQLMHFQSRGWFSPDWSPDGRQIVYAHTPGLWVMNADGSGNHVVLRSGEAVPIQRGEPAWSPDGKSIAFTAALPSPLLAPRIWVVAVDGTNPHPVSTVTGDQNAVSDSAADWQPVRQPGSAPRDRADRHR